MATIYDNITSAAELVKHVKTCGRQTDIDSTIRIQDIIGRSTMDELIALANGEGRVDDNGNPDPEGCYKKDHLRTRETFYSILFGVWNWEDATRFYIQNSSPEMKELRQLRKEVKEARESAAKWQMKHQELKEYIGTEENRCAELGMENLGLEEEIKDLKMEIMALKAKLYDLMVKENM